MIDKIRDYIRGMVKRVDSDLVENDSAFYDFDIGETLLDRSFQISINNPTRFSKEGGFIERRMAIRVSIFGLGYRTQVSNYDYLLDKAVCIEDTILSLQNFSGIETITNIDSTGILAERLPSNDDAFQITINLTLSQAYYRE